MEQDNIIKLMPIKFYPVKIHCGWLEMSAFLNVSFNLEFYGITAIPKHRFWTIFSLVLDSFIVEG